jgi:hypothetical protein
VSFLYTQPILLILSLGFQFIYYVLNCIVCMFNRRMIINMNWKNVKGSDYDWHLSEGTEEN